MSADVDAWMQLLAEGHRLRWRDRKDNHVQPSGRVLLEVMAVGRFYWLAVRAANTAVVKSWLYPREQPFLVRHLLGSDLKEGGELEIEEAGPNRLVDAFVDSDYELSLCLDGLSVGIEETVTIRRKVDGLFLVSERVHIQDGMGHVTETENTLDEAAMLQRVREEIAQGSVPHVYRRS